ncbi:alternative ribosome rescue aminoacyl-tRNA hydrolase ArfB [Nesterenkonia haasae]|uniref:alternative ribosome rescue aminoacyl-tRNA hydrolase ArfB n=1 Tax=Nesterenkonia haasae TaxID=2587813 RepID=UPI00192E783A
MYVSPGPGAPEGLTVPARELREQFSHASGPGGQGVNTTDSRVQLSLDIATTSSLTEDQRRLIFDRLATRLSGTVLTVNAAEHRSQRRNRTAARDRLAELLREAVTPPVPRRPTRRTRGSHRRRLERKSQRSQVKQSRRRPRPD